MCCCCFCFQFKYCDTFVLLIMQMKGTRFPEISCQASGVHREHTLLTGFVKQHYYLCDAFVIVFHRHQTFASQQVRLVKTQTVIGFQAGRQKCLEIIIFSIPLGAEIKHFSFTKIKVSKYIIKPLSIGINFYGKAYFYFKAIRTDSPGNLHTFIISLCVYIIFIINEKSGYYLAICRSSKPSS